jgi:outer membrane receptor protein involved in Fe transport
MKSLILITLFILTGSMTLAQQTMRINGGILDANTRNPVEYATVTVIDKGSGKAINGAMSDSKGAFVIARLPAGIYKITIEFIGYKPYKIDSLVVDGKERSITLNTVYLSPLSNALGPVTITADAPVIENKIDKIVYNAANDITSQGGAAIDVLKKVPQVMVDIDGNVELQGNSNILFLINGKPSSIFGNSLVDALASIPANQIKSIEVITSPGAKYDAQGTGGIINIILKENKMQGVNGAINLSAGTRLENVSVNLNMRRGKFGINTFFTGNAQLVSHTPNSQNRYSYDTSGYLNTHLTQDGYNDFQRNSYQAGIGFDWDLSKKEQITGALNFFHVSSENRYVIDQEEQDFDAGHNILSDVFTVRNSDNRSTNNSSDLSLAYHKKFRKEDEEIDILYSASYGNPYNTYIQTQIYRGQSVPFIGSSSNNPGTDQQNNFSLDYADPVSKSISIETGAKFSMQSIHSTADVNSYNTAMEQYLPDPQQSYILNYNRDIYAAYISGNFSTFHFLDVKAGFRFEHADTKIDFPNTTIPGENDYVPSVILSHKINRDQTVKLMYSHRIERPEYGEVNPFVNLSDPNNITTGNPLLLPELGNNFEMGYNRSFSKGGNIYIAMAERINSQDIKPVTVFYSAYRVGDSVYNNVSVTNRQNVGTEYNSGIILSGSVPVNSEINMRGNIFAMQRYVVSPLASGGNVSGFRLRCNLNLTYQLPKDLILEGFINYNSASVGLQGNFPQSLTYTFAFRKQFWNKKASLGFTATNPFTQYVDQLITINTENYSSSVLRQMPYRSFGINCIYKFGKMEFKKQKDEDNSYQSELPNQ